MRGCGWEREWGGKRSRDNKLELIVKDTVLDMHQSNETIEGCHYSSSVAPFSILFAWKWNWK